MVFSNLNHKIKDNLSDILEQKGYQNISWANKNENCPGHIQFQENGQYKTALIKIRGLKKLFGEVRERKITGNYKNITVDFVGYDTGKGSELKALFEDVDYYIYGYQEENTVLVASLKKINAASLRKDFEPTSKIKQGPNGAFFLIPISEIEQCVHNL